MNLIEHTNAFIDSGIPDIRLGPFSCLQARMSIIINQEFQLFIHLALHFRRQPTISRSERVCELKFQSIDDFRWALLFKPVDSLYQIGKPVHPASH